MAAFTDTLGRIWEVRITISSLRRIKDLTGLKLTDLKGLEEGGDLNKVFTDYIAMATALYAACKPQADALAVNMDDFTDAIAGDALNQAQNALLEAMADFFPGAPATLLRKVLEAVKQQQKENDSTITKLIDAPEFDASLQKMMTPTSK